MCGDVFQWTRSVGQSESSCRQSDQIYVFLPPVSVTTEHETEDTSLSLTVPVDVLVAGVSLSVAVSVSLVAVGDVGTVIAGVSERVAV